MSSKEPTTDQLRRAIDSGATGDKVNSSDPAAAPLGTDEEAGGRTPTPVERAMSLRQELRTGSSAARRGAKSGWTSVQLAVIVAFCVALAAVAWAIWKYGA
jgi:hypothetical protein